MVPQTRKTPFGAQRWFFFSPQVPLLTSAGSEIKLAGSDFFRSHFPRQLWSSSKRSFAALTSMLSKLQLVTEAGP